MEGWETVYDESSCPEKAGLAVLVSDNVDFSAKTNTGDEALYLL